MGSQTAAGLKGENSNPSNPIQATSMIDQALVPDDPLPFVEKGWLYDYQTLIAGSLALIAALIAARIAYSQLAEVRRQERRAREGRLRAARATLPTALSTICAYAQETARALWAGRPAPAKFYPGDYNSMQLTREQIATPPFPAETYNSLERVVEFTTCEEVASRVESILREAQVLEARVRPLNHGADVSLHQLVLYILEAAAIYARAESLFAFARGQADGPTGDLWERTFAALSIMGVDDDLVLEEARAQRDAGLPPGEADTKPIV
mgnify:CR=1 FL=1